MTGYLLVALGGAIGAPLRYLTDRAVQDRHRRGFPWGTFTVNMVGSLVLGLLTGLTLGLTGPAAQHWQLLIGTGLCGALTTYSTFSLETVRLWEQRQRWSAVANVLGSIAGGLGFAALGFLIGRG